MYVAESQIDEILKASYIIFLHTKKPLENSQRAVSYLISFRI